MSCYKDAESIVKPFLEQHRKDYNEGNFDKLAEYYHPDAILVVAGKKGTYGRDAIKQEKMEYSERTGKASHGSLKLSNENYQMTDDFIFYCGDSEYQTEKAGKLKAKFSKIFKKTNGKYLLLREQWNLEE
ncbi:unnamed protein product [Cylicocyclus nassatus]|uniref:DUF4440 domain-containing protein n=1 Tax=Cylicocyclus nassatus TaxID=53992 RepID=A0AA36M9I4_CYLNA|nr:unnamed protein product [Cylicocyclus nassatus]